MRSFAAVAFLSVLAGVSNTQTIDPNSVDISLRQNWCLSQQTQCPLICYQYPDADGEPQANDCDAENLDWHCVCSNGMSPNASEYSQTIPYYECTELANQCVAACGSNNACSDKCRSAHPCGAQSPKRVNTSTITTMSATATGNSPSQTGDQLITGFGGTPTATGTSGNKSGAGSMAMELGQSYGLALVLAGLFGGFALVL